MTKTDKEPSRDYPYPFSPNKIIIDGHALSYLDEGHGPVIVMLHGNPTWSFYYRKLVMRLRADYRVIAPDHMGCGLSDKPQDYPYRLENHIRNVEMLLEKLAIEKFSLVMHDWGGAIGMGVAGRRPRNIESLVILNTAAFRSDRIPWRIRICRFPVLGDIAVRGFNLFCRAALSMAVTKPLASEVVRGYLAPYDSWHNRIAILRFVQDIPMKKKDSSWETLKAVEKSLDQFKQTPMLLLWGGKDFCFTRHFFEQWKTRFPQAESRFFERSGHYILEEEFDSIFPIVAAFYKKYLN